VQPKLAVSHETINISICSATSSNIRMLQDSATTVNDSLLASIIAKPSITSTASFPLSPFPPHLFDAYHPK